MISKAEFVTALCTLLAFSSAVQILITGMLFFKFSHFLGLAHCHLSTAAGVVSGLVAVPMVVQLKTSQIAPHIDRKYGYTLWYRRLAIGVCSILHLASILIVMYFFIKPIRRNEEFLEKMDHYDKKISTKALIDNVQWALECCGADSYEDWKTFEPQKLPWIMSAYYKEHVGDISKVNEVPFSCCAKRVLGTCYHSNLHQFGTATINVSGCAPKLTFTAHVILGVELSIYCLCFGIEVTILMLLHKTGNVEESEIDEEFLIHKYLQQAKKKTSGSVSTHTSRYSQKMKDSGHQIIHQHSYWLEKISHFR